MIPRNANRCSRCLEGDHARCTGSAGNVGCGCIHAAPVPQHVVPDEATDAIRLPYTLPPQHRPAVVVWFPFGGPAGGVVSVRADGSVWASSPTLAGLAEEDAVVLLQRAGYLPAPPPPEPVYRADRDALLDVLGVLFARTDLPDEVQAAALRARRHLDRTS